MYPKSLIEWSRTSKCLSNTHYIPIIYRYSHTQKFYIIKAVFFWVISRAGITLPGYNQSERLKATAYWSHTIVFFQQYSVDSLIDHLINITARLLYRLYINEYNIILFYYYYIPILVLFTFFLELNNSYNIC